MMATPILIMWLLAIALILHVFEEVWVSEYKKGQVTWGTVILNYAPIVENIPIFIFAIVLAVIGWRSPMISGILLSVCLTHPLLDHVGLSIKTQSIRAGSLTAIFLMLPLSIWAYAVGYNNALFQAPALVISGMTGLGISIWLFWEVEKELQQKSRSS
ncbi:hypothetical protein Lepto7376_3989 [[Leptolyngbya] sp. PCC 7376]|uniref:HXXEE domain-containing protein n=1 Tax=[Leptolyngbya] sp. PCC 7376 TaxID=111781 RepID=UPI00029F2D90|nr:HXXEE domain-containing protein [[Leptolyngbya] sp. PCC 7376]AFY40128.1 hypothetical protein Lepto7376_3989 [[Leptolyngbya] sp. PCC 7376]